VLIWRDYRGDVRVGAAERFRDIWMSSEEEAKPIFVEDGITYVSVKHNNLIRALSPISITQIPLFIFTIHIPPTNICHLLAHQLYIY
jgi:hypothetical protein